jgi:exodeoxyribonuclease VII small subunit
LPEVSVPEESEIRFEEAVSQLEQIVESLERGEPELATALSKYETGVRLLTQCYDLLEGAERAVALLTGVDEQGNPITAPFDAKASIEREARTGSDPPVTSGDPTGLAPPKQPRPRRTRTSLDETTNPLEPPF